MYPVSYTHLEVDIVTGLEAGANDYITKPFSLMVLRARVSVQMCIRDSITMDGIRWISMTMSERILIMVKNKVVLKERDVWLSLIHIEMCIRDRC